MGNALAPGCCGCCNIVDLTDQFESVIAAGAEISYEHPRETGNWTVDVEVINAKPGNGAVIRVGDIETTIDTVSGNHSIKLRVGQCVTVSRATGFWLRHQEVTIDPTESPKRRRRVEVWSSDPSASGATSLGSACFDFVVDEDDEPYEPPISVWIKITAGTDAVTIGKVRAGDTSLDKPGCPPVPCVATPCISGGPRTWLATNVRLELNGFGEIWTRCDYSGLVQIRFGSASPTGPVNVWQQLKLDYSAFNGTHALTFLKDNAPLTPEEMDDEIAIIMERGLCASEATRFGWQMPTFDLSSIAEYTRGPDSSGINFHPAGPQATDTASRVLQIPTFPHTSLTPLPSVGPVQPLQMILAGMPTTGSVFVAASQGFSSSGPLFLLPSIFAQHSPISAVPSDEWAMLGDLPLFASCAPREHGTGRYTHNLNFTLTETGPSHIGTYQRTFTSNVVTVTGRFLVDYVAL